MRESAAQLLTQHFLFRSLSKEILARIADLASTRQLPANAVLFLKGDDADGLYGVLQGRIKISVSSAAGKEVTLNLLEPGEFFGEIALLDGLPRTADATAADDAELLFIPRPDFMRLIQSEPELAIHLLRLICQRLRWTNEKLEDVSFLDLSARLAKKLLSLASIHGVVDEAGRIRLRLPQHELADMLGTSRESINKHLQKWRREGWIELTRGQVLIDDPDALRALVEDIE